MHSELLNLEQETRQLLLAMGAGRHITPSAYDTAWVARLRDFDRTLSDMALDWLCANQLPDGSWGAAQPKNYQDRLVCTLSALIALARRGRRESDRRQIALGQAALEQLHGEGGNGTSASLPYSTVGFELIVPTLMAEAERLGIIQRQDGSLLARLDKARTRKLASLPKGMINRYVTVAFSAEMAADDTQHLLDVPNLQEANGSVAYSPAATAYFASLVRPGDPGALSYLRSMADANGAYPYVVPVDVFETAWPLWNLTLHKEIDPGLLALCQPHLDFLTKYWQPGRGMASVAGLSLVDGDATSTTFEVLARFGCAPDVAGVMNFEADQCFRCYALESDASLSTNVHVLGALRAAGFEAQHPVVQKVVNFLRQMQTSQAFWSDKWHVSPYYVTAHAIIASAGYTRELAEAAVQWMLRTQNADGSWGYLLPTAEETAYCLQALAVWRRLEGPVPAQALECGAAWLVQHTEPPYPPLWIGKSLYHLEYVVRSAIVSALRLAV